MREVGHDIAPSPPRQAALLTAVNTGRRCFLGGVQVTGNVGATLRVPWRSCRTLGDAIIGLQGKLTARVDPALPRIVFGDAEREASSSPFAVKAPFEGRAGGVIPPEAPPPLPHPQQFPPPRLLPCPLACSE